MGLLILLTILVLAAGAGLFTLVALITHPRAEHLDAFSRRQQRDDLVRSACADLDREYRELLER